jgi:hypothetical protein
VSDELPETDVAVEGGSAEFDSGDGRVASYLLPRRQLLRGIAPARIFAEYLPRPAYTEARPSSAGEKGAWRVSDQSTTVLQGYLDRAVTGDVAARQRLLELTHDRLMRHARRHLHGSQATRFPR